ncbi:MAG: hypothetical protein Tsb002_27650 [Wenzhouxiangellaceae bacterium]
MKIYNRAPLWCVLLMLVNASANAGNSVYTVNSLNDPGIGVCDASECTLREAITAAGSDGVPSDIIFSADLQGAIFLTSQLNIAADTAILGPGPERLRVSGDGLSRVFFIPAAANNIVISGLTISNGDTGNVPSPIPRNGAGIYVLADQVLLTHLRVINNRSITASGGIEAYGSSLVITHTEISDNTAQDTAGFAWTGFGDELRMENVTVQGNFSKAGVSGLSIQSTALDHVVLRHVTVAQNTGAGSIGSDIRGLTGDITISGSIFANHGTFGGDLRYFAPEGNLVHSLIETPVNPFPASNNIIGLDPLFERFGYQPAGAVTRSFSLTPGSPAIDLVPLASQGCGTDIAIDQVGQPRPLLLGCDAGAWEASDAAPTAFDDSATVVPNQAVTINVAANDIEPGGAVDPASVTIVAGASNGTVTTNGDGTVTYTPVGGFGGPTDEFRYRIADDDGDVSLPATVTLHFQPVADPAVSITGPDFIVSGIPVIYQIDATNTGAVPIFGVRVTGQFDDRFTVLDWECNATSNAACGGTSGSSEIDEPIDLLVGGRVRFTITAIIGPLSDKGDVIAQATITPGSNEPDLNPLNNMSVTVAAVALFTDGFESPPTNQ